MEEIGWIALGVLGVVMLVYSCHFYYFNDSFLEDDHE